MDTKVGTEKKQPADEVAKLGYEAMMRGEGDVIAGWGNKLRAAIANVTPNEMSRGFGVCGCLLGLPCVGRAAVSGTTPRPRSSRPGCVSRME